MSDVIDFRDRRPLSTYDIARRLARRAEHRRIAIDTRCRVAGGDSVVTVIGPPDAFNRYPVRLALACGEPHDFTLPAISLTPIEGEQPR